ncbi:MAG TPA: 6-phosphogluconolactonase [Pilimelia sp.]|nr:6-phosphogluconolactonase [Pilimelia sp.]
MTAIEERLCPDLPGVARAAAAAFARQVDIACRRRGVCHAALTGDPGLGPMYRLLATDLRDHVPWQRCRFFVSDESVASADSPSRNAVIGDQLPGLDTHPDSFHPVPVDLGDARTVADAYQTRIRAVVPSGPDGVPVFDLVLLGMGADDCVSSTLLREPAPDRPGPLTVVSAPTGWRGAPRHVAFAPALVNRARCVLVMATGAESAGAYARLRERFAGSPPRHPAAAPMPGGVLCFVDPAAAGT